MSSESSSPTNRRTPHYILALPADGAVPLRIWRLIRSLRKLYSTERVCVHVYQTSKPFLFRPEGRGRGQMTHFWMEVGLDELPERPDHSWPVRD